MEGMKAQKGTEEVVEKCKKKSSKLTLVLYFVKPLGLTFKFYKNILTHSFIHYRKALIVCLIWCYKLGTRG